MHKPPAHQITVRSRLSLAWPRVRQQGRLAVGVSATAGGAWLLVTNLAHVAAVGLTASGLVPLTANAALLFGGVMFLREYRNGRRSR